MPYELSFTRRVRIVDRERYINECCVGGDVVLNRVLPVVRARYTDVQTNQEDWGWFIWFRKGPVRLAVDVFTENPDEGTFRVVLTSRLRRLVVLDTVVDTPELDELVAVVRAELEPWVGRPLSVEQVAP